MASKLKIARVGPALVWTDRTSGRQIFSFNVETGVNPTLETRIRDYGLKQILSDAAAGTKTEKEAVEAMSKRAASLGDGSWGTRQPSLPDADVFMALVGLRKLPDSDDARAKWAALKPAERRALGRIPEVVEWLEANGAGDEDAENILAAFK